MPNNQDMPIPFKLLFGRRSQETVEVRVIESPLGEPRTNITIPIEGDWPAISSGMAEEGDLDKAGQALYEALFGGEIKSAFAVAQSKARTEKRTITLQLRFDEEAAQLADYPWELLHDGRRSLLIAGELDLARYIAYPEANVPLKPASPPLRILYVGSSPKNLPPDLDLEAPVKPLRDIQSLEIDTSTPPIYDALMDRLAPHNPPVDVLYFYGHGRVLDGQGALAFQKDDGSLDIVKAKDLAVALGGSEVKLALLVACRSAAMGQETVFSATGPALIQAGVPAVVSMQYDIPAEAGVTFARSLFEAVAKGQPLTEAMISARRMLYRGKSWYIPTLYLRSADDAGLLLKPAAGSAKPPIQPDTTPFTPPPSPPSFAVRGLLTAAFDSQEFQGFCEDHFEEVAKKFTLGMTQSQRVGLLLDYCKSHNRIGELLALVRRYNRPKYDEFAPRLEGRE